MLVLYRAPIATPVGELSAVATDAGLCALSFDMTGRRDQPDRRLHKWFAPFDWRDATNPIIDQTRDWLARYFAREWPDARGVPLDLRGTPFERRVWEALLDVAPGTTTTYGALAKRLGSASRAVGLANGSNPVPIIVPCHRVIGSNGTLTGYGGGLERKAWLIRHEGGRLF